MRSKGILRRFATGFGLLVVIAVLAALAGTSAFAFNPATDTNDTTNGVSASSAGTVSVTTLNVASTARVVSSYSSNLLASAQAGSASGATNIRTMYQQWRHTVQNDWFYVYAQNGGTSATVPVWDYYYYAPGRGSTRLNNTASQANGTNLTSQSLVATYVFLSAGTTVPAFWAENVQATASNCSSAGAGAACAGNTFVTELGWGLGMQGFRNEGGAGAVALQTAAETFPYPAGGVGASRTYYDGWKSVNSGAPSVALGNAAPTQSATGVTNASGARNANTATSYTSVQTVGDVEGDLSSGSVIWVFTSGTQAGQWFQAGIYVNRAMNGYRSGTSGVAFYQSWNEAFVAATSGSQITTNYFTTLTISGAMGLSDRGAGQQALNSLVITYSYVYSNAARGAVTLWARAEDYHGRSSGNVQVGTQTIT